MTSPRAGYASPSGGVPINLSSEELSALENNLRFEFGPSVVTPQQGKELRMMLDLADKDIEGYMSEVARLEVRRAKILALLSPMRKLPNETLLHIFELVCAKNLLRCHPWLPDEKTTPTKVTAVITFLPTMAISSVCSRWRALALSAPSLWANLTVTTHTTMNEAAIFSGFTDTVNRYLTRSGASPIRLTLTIHGFTDATEVPALTHLIEHAQRWKTFEYKGHYSLTKHSMLSGVRFPLLVELDNRFESNLTNLFGHCSKLHTISISQSIGTIPGTRLRHLDFCGLLSLTDLDEALRSCPSLKSLKLGLMMNSVLKEDALRYYNITALTLINDASSETLFSSFNFPYLNTLVVDGRVIKLLPNNFPSFITRSCCMITSFTLLGMSMHDSDLIAVLRVMPALLHLEVDQLSNAKRNPITSHLISRLTHRQSTATVLVPELHSLHLRYEPSGEFDDAAFVNMVESRWFKPGSELSAEMLAMGRNSIRSVVLKFTSREVDVDIYMPLWVLDAVGLRVVVSGTNGVQV
ncbi:hypothetical protein BDP27DRAFT_1423912 [Rhodocollybia butyracea]|uniref:F-box domain-containing protein n=1 Tax=Rhodocollybia butyracea TaxID=206335 RepID=A0A9P5U4X7_9AGAR|nr:hypothetical protein BDP27DRAFT_1423912 [Rhodocollybia butyracea]